MGISSDDAILFGVDPEASVDDQINSCLDILEDHTFPTVKRWRERGGKVLGHFQVYFPEELAHAAGMLPVKVRGAPIDRREADSRFGSYLCSIIRSSLELALSEELVVDLFVTHPICDAARNLAGIWGRNRPESAQILYLPQNPNSSGSVEYLRGEYRRMLDDIEEVTGTPVSDDALRASIAVFNTNRELLRDLYDIKRETPWLLASHECYVLTALAGLIPREEHNELLERLIPLIKQRNLQPKDRIRVVFEGGFCEQPPLDLLRGIGHFCDVVDDDLLIGLRWIIDDLATEGDPLEVLSDGYINHSTYSPVQHDRRKPKEDMLLDRIRGARAEACIVSAAKMCEPGLDEQVAYGQALDKENIPYFITEFEEKMNSFDHLQIQLETFLENLLFV